jgi:hypothetical protein
MSKQFIRSATGIHLDTAKSKKFSVPSVPSFSGTRHQLAYRQADQGITADSPHTKKKTITIHRYNGASMKGKRIPTNHHVLHGMFIKQFDKILKIFCKCHIRFNLFFLIIDLSIVSPSARDCDIK